MVNQGLMYRIDSINNYGKLKLNSKFLQQYLNISNVEVHEFIFNMPVYYRKADVQFFRSVHVKSIEIRGHMIGEVVADTVVVIHRNASLVGNVTAKSISVEKGGMFTGQLIIGSSGLQQAELLPPVPAPKAEPASSSDEDMLPGLVPPLHAT